MEGIFIVGYWNSGTTLLTDVLRKHPKLSLKKGRFLPNLEERSTQKLMRKEGSDFFDFGDYSDVINNKFKNYPQPDWDATKIKSFQKGFRRIFETRNSKILLLKNPWLFFYEEWINRIFSNDAIKKIVILRNGYSQAVSKDYWLKSEQEPKEELEARTKFWKIAIERYFETWHNDPDCLTIRYENLCTNPEETIKEVCDFCSIDYASISKKIPDAFENRMTRWQELDPDLKSIVIKELRNIQLKMDKNFPLIKPLQY